MAEWTKEKGPACFCGGPTWVEPWPEGAELVCLLHTKAAGASFPLPAARPDNWPDLTREELHAFMTQGAKEAEEREVADGE
jgi:hypothetical protein